MDEKTIFSFVLFFFKLDFLTRICVLNYLLLVTEMRIRKQENSITKAILPDSPEIEFAVMSGKKCTNLEATARIPCFILLNNFCSTYKTEKLGNVSSKAGKLVVVGATMK